ncbi:MAG: hypothetical protein ACSW78_04335, partial [Lachnospiraceae bacterium]
MNEFSCLHGNERYGACDDASTVITSIGFCPQKIQIHSLPACGPSQGVPPYDPAKNKYFHSK